MFIFSQLIFKLGDCIRFCKFHYLQIFCDSHLDTFQSNIIFCHVFVCFLGKYFIIAVFLFLLNWISFNPTPFWQLFSAMYIGLIFVYWFDFWVNILISSSHCVCLCVFNFRKKQVNFCVFNFRCKRTNNLVVR